MKREHKLPQGGSTVSVRFVLERETRHVEENERKRGNESVKERNNRHWHVIRDGGVQKSVPF
jgi:hypothetical protein